MHENKNKISTKTRVISSLESIKYFLIWFITIFIIFFAIKFIVLRDDVEEVFISFFIGSLALGFVGYAIQSYIFNKKKKSNELGDREKIQILRNRLPNNFKKNVFYPSSFFYECCKDNPEHGIQVMSNALFTWLNIARRGCVINFLNEDCFRNKEKNDIAGYFSKIKENNREKEVISINSKYRNEPFAVGAILAHEITHLYLSRLNIELDDKQENELLTDLATIQIGFSILILNGMSYFSDWWLSIILFLFGIRYWQSSQKSFGYFEPREYGKYSLEYLRERHIKSKDMFGYINPASRHLISLHWRSLKSRDTTTFIRKIERKQNMKNIIKSIVVVCAIIAVIYIYSR